MENYLNTNNCLTYDQLKWYVTHSHTGEKGINIYQHLATCQLCASAVNGFTLLPFTDDVITKLNKRIDLITKPKSFWTPLMLGQVGIVVVSLMSIFGFYIVANGITKSTIHSEVSKPIAKTSHLVIKQEPPVIERIENNYTPLIAEPRIETIEEEECRTEIEPLNSRNPNILFPENNTAAVDSIERMLVTDELYIEDLKVADYNKLYFHDATFEECWTRYIPAHDENNKANMNDIIKDDAQYYLATKVLTRGLIYFKKQKYEDAISQFNMLLENNSDDVNAQFYKGKSLAELQDYSSAIFYFKKVLHNDNLSFYEEAKWNLAATYKLVGDNSQAEYLLKEIVNDKGFYAKQAAKLLRK